MLSFLVAAVAIALAAVPRSVPLWLKLVLLAGGAAGAALVVLVAPLISQAFYEWPLGLVLAFLVAAVAVTAAAASPTAPRGLKLAMAVSLGTVTVLGLGLLLQLLLVLPSHARSSKGITVERARNFFGIVSIRDYRRDEPDEHQYVMRHGAIEHGEQFVDPAKRHIPLTYYRYDSGVGRTIMHLQKQRPTMRVGVVGLGAGTIAAYARKGDSYCFYEINPAVEQLADHGKYFTYLSDARRRGATVEVCMGDGRLSLEREPPERQFDVLVLDAFSGDAIPAHLLTCEAFGSTRSTWRPGA